MGLKSFTIAQAMSKKKKLPKEPKVPLQGTIAQLNTAFRQWDSLTSPPKPEQGVRQIQIKKNTKTLLKKLQQQMKQFK